MKPFSFRLQTKLKVSNIYEDIAKEQLRDQLLTRDNIADQLLSIDQQVLELEHSIRAMKTGSDTYKRMVLSREYLPVLNRRKDSIIHELDKAEEKVELARDVLIARTRETSTLEKLKEKDWSAYMYECRMEEQKQIDEAAIGTFYKNRIQTAV